MSGPKRSRNLRQSQGNPDFDDLFSADLLLNNSGSILLDDEGSAARGAPDLHGLSPFHFSSPTPPHPPATTGATSHPALHPPHSHHAHHAHHQQPQQHHSPHSGFSHPSSSFVSSEPPLPTSSSTSSSSSMTSSLPSSIPSSTSSSSSSSSSTSSSSSSSSSSTASFSAALSLSGDGIGPISGMGGMGWFGSRDSTDDIMGKMELFSQEPFLPAFFSSSFPNSRSNSGGSSNRSSTDEGIIPVTPSSFSFLPATTASASNSISTLPPSVSIVRDDEEAADSHLRPSGFPFAASASSSSSSSSSSPFFSPTSSGGSLSLSPSSSPSSSSSSTSSSSSSSSSSSITSSSITSSSSSSSSSLIPNSPFSTTSSSSGGRVPIGPRTPKGGSWDGELPRTPGGGVASVGEAADSSERVGVDAIIRPKIQNLMQLSYQINEKIGQVAAEQKQTPIPYSEATAEGFFVKHNQIRCAIEWAAQQIQQIHQNYLLQPPDIYSLMSLQGRFYRMMKQTELYQLEVQHFSSPAPQKSIKHLISMIIVRQPFPKPLKQGSPSSSHTEDPIDVVLLHAANLRVQPSSKVQAVVIHEEYQSKSVGFLSQVKIISEDQPFDSELCVSFTDIKFDKGTRLKVVRLHFTAKIQYMCVDGTSGSLNLESEATNPFIVITNESQWDNSEGLLFSKEAFPVNQVPWIQFANILQMHYLRTTRQDPQKPERPLSVYDLRYILRTQFNNKRYITQKDFMDFWEGFGKIMHKIRHQKAFAMLWIRGLVWGFISKAEAEALLEGKPAGTFVTRFSERVPGKLAIAYVKEDARFHTLAISHYLVAPNDKKDLLTLPDFLAENEGYIWTLQVNTSFNPSPPLIVNSLHKDEAFGAFYTKQALAPTGLEGYENVSRKKTQRPV